VTPTADCLIHIPLCKGVLFQFIQYRGTVQQYLGATHERAEYFLIYYRTFTPEVIPNHLSAYQPRGRRPSMSLASYLIHVHLRARLTTRTSVNSACACPCPFQTLYCMITFLHTSHKLQTRCSTCIMRLSDELCHRSIGSLKVGPPVIQAWIVLGMLSVCGLRTLCSALGTEGPKCDTT